MKCFHALRKQSAVPAAGTRALRAGLRSADAPLFEKARGRPGFLASRHSFLRKNVPYSPTWVARYLDNKW